MSSATTITEHSSPRYRIPLKKPNENVANKDAEVDTSYQDFFWTYTEEPHRTRRQAIIKAHPEVTKLCGPEPLTKYTVSLVVAIQLFCAFALRTTPFFSLRYFLAAYCIGATSNQNLFLAIHEISHNLAFRSPNANRALAMIANLPVGIPYYASFRPYHLTHHKSLGVDGFDVDLPTSWEAIFLNSVAGKAFFCTFQIFFYALRPMFVLQLPITTVHLINIMVQLMFDALIVLTLGWNSLAYFVLSSFLAGSLHPCAAHFIAEHYIFAQHQAPAPAASSKTANLCPPETFSYYGPLNLLCYNVGLHNEHHDFPAIPWTRLEKLHNIAKEFYDELPSHKSWVYVLWQFICDERVGLWCRLKRKDGGRKVGGLSAQDQGE